MTEPPPGEKPHDRRDGPRAQARRHGLHHQSRIRRQSREARSLEVLPIVREYLPESEDDDVVADHVQCRLVSRICERFLPLRRGKMSVRSHTRRRAQGRNAYCPCQKPLDGRIASWTIVLR